MSIGHRRSARCIAYDQTQPAPSTSCVKSVTASAGAVPLAAVHSMRWRRPRRKPESTSITSTCGGVGRRGEEALRWRWGFISASGSCGRPGDEMARVRELVRMGGLLSVTHLERRTAHAEDPRGAEGGVVGTAERVEDGAHQEHVERHQLYGSAPTCIHIHMH